VSGEDAGAVPYDVRQAVAQATKNAYFGKFATYDEQDYAAADAVLSVPAVAEAFAAAATLAEVRRIVDEGCPEASPNRLVLLAARYRRIAVLLRGETEA